MSKWHDLGGEQKKQLLITSNQLGKPLGVATRVECHTGKGKTHLAFVAFLSNDEGKIYLQKRSDKKSLWNGFWDASIVSHVLPGETVEEAARRRGKEELGIDASFISLGGFYYYADFNGNCENEYCYTLVGESNDKVIHNPVEIEEVKLIKVSELNESVKKGKENYTPWLKLALDKFKNELLNEKRI